MLSRAATKEEMEGPDQIKIITLADLSIFRESELKTRKNAVVIFWGRIKI